MRFLQNNLLNLGSQSKILHMKSCDSIQVESIRQSYGDVRTYESYTAEDHSTWRLALRRILGVVEQRSVIPFRDALVDCGISIQEIPQQQVIDHHLAKFDWRSLLVKTFIPPWDFMTLQAHRVLPTTFQIRAHDQLDYTPIPDLIHEVIGHIPMLANERYRAFLEKLGRIGSAIPLTAIDKEFYVVQTKLAELRGQGCDIGCELEELELQLTELSQLQSAHATPICLLSRFQWWTVEYGLMGRGAKIFGAGLLSSAQEAVQSDQTPKLHLDLDCLDQDYRITEMQPQLFVAEDWNHLDSELDRFNNKVCQS